jgi:hypothetical protein
MEPTKILITAVISKIGEKGIKKTMKMINEADRKLWSDENPKRDEAKDIVNEVDINIENVENVENVEMIRREIEKNQDELDEICHKITKNDSIKMGEIRQFCKQ